LWNSTEWQEKPMAEMTFAQTAGSIRATDTLPRCGIAAGTSVLTLRGPVAVESVAPGDRLITRNGARKVVSVEIATLAEAEVVRICEGVLGKDRPEVDMVVAPEQPILIRDWRAKAIAGVDQAVMTAKRLADGEYIRIETRTNLRLVTLFFDDEQVIYAAGMELACGAVATV